MMKSSNGSPSGSPPEQPAPERATDGSAPGTPRWHGRRARQAIERGKQKYAGSSAESLWGRLSAMDFLNQALLLAATLLLCAIPFFLVLNALAGRSLIPVMTHRMGLTRQASNDVGDLFASTAATSSSITGASYVLFVLGGLAAASTIQQLYLRIFDLPAQKRDRLRVLAWLGLVVGCLFLFPAVGPGLRGVAPVLFWMVYAVLITGFWWFSMWLLLAGRIPWRNLMPSAVATGVCWSGMSLVFSVVFSGMVVSNNQKYGAIGVVFAFMSFFIAIGVVLILGPMIGMTWEERGLSFRSVLRKMRRTS